MKSATRTILEKAIGPRLSSAGFRKSGSSWYARSAESILLVNLQKSNWGNAFYLNLGVYLKALGGADAPKTYECHIGDRLEGIVAKYRMVDGTLVGDYEAQKRVQRLLDFEANDAPVEAKVAEFAKMVDEIAIPWLLDLSTCEKIRAALLSPERAKRLRAAMKPEVEGACGGRA